MDAGAGRGEGGQEEGGEERCDELIQGRGGLNEGLRDWERVGGLSSTEPETGGSASTQLVPPGETSTVKQKGRHWRPFCFVL